jgi:fructose-1,6-bisphosphatase/inositol monophosphatase family enzyme
METFQGIDLAAALDVAASAVTDAGRILLELRRKPVEILSEPGHDIKLKADQLAEELILRILAERLPLPVLTEESGEHGAVDDAALMWVVDPLDGTFNYSRGMPLCCSSVGLWAGGKPVLGAVFNFFQNEMFTASWGAARGSTAGPSRFPACRRRPRRRSRRAFRTTRTTRPRPCAISSGRSRNSRRSACWDRPR